MVSVLLMDYFTERGDGKVEWDCLVSWSPHFMQQFRKFLSSRRSRVHLLGNLQQSKVSRKTQKMSIDRKAKADAIYSSIDFDSAIIAILPRLLTFPKNGLLQGMGYSLLAKGSV